MQATLVPIPVDQDKFLDTQTASDFLSLTPDTLRRMRAEGRGPRCTKLNARVTRYRLSELIRYASGGQGQE